MKAELECLQCVVLQATRAARTATSDPERQRQILNEVAARIPHMDLDHSPAFISQIAYEKAAELTGNPDPYRDLKRAQNEAALALEPHLRELMANSECPLTTALHLAAAGNVIDLGIMTSEEIDPQAAVDDVMRERFAVEHLERFRESLAACDDFLYLLDNAGEIVFDKLLIEELSKHTHVTAVVKGGPILNDATMEDAEHVGITDACSVIDNGGAYIGAPPNLVTAGFRERMEQADVILGKGQANYETIDDFPGDVYLLLKAKCEIVARHMGVKLGQVGLISTRARREEQKNPTS
jgi:hypothetical protein